MWVALEGAEMVGRREVDGLLLKSENIFFLPSPFAPSDRRSCLVFPSPESIRAGVAAMVKNKERTRTRRFSAGQGVEVLVAALRMELGPIETERGGADCSRDGVATQQREWRETEHGRVDERKCGGGAVSSKRATDGGVVVMETAVVEPELVVVLVVWR
jgi:hypothetical protein